MNELFKKIDGVYVSTRSLIKYNDFENKYLALRAKENRILSIEEIRSLPFVSNKHPDYQHWEIRRKNISRFIKYLSKKKGVLSILDVGCGNGFFTHLMAIQNHQIVGLDVNLIELKQAALAFNVPNIKWHLAELMEDELPQKKYDIITFCASIQYFKNPSQVIKYCLTQLYENGEIHIIDSPFYSENEKQIARLNSEKHFEKMGVVEMKNYYHHNSYEVLKDFNFKKLYNPKNIFRRIARKKDSPFPWIIVKH